MIHPLTEGFLIYFAFTMSIGPQNIVMLRAGFGGDSVFILASAFVLCDAVLLGIGAWQIPVVGAIAASNPALLHLLGASVMTLLGAASLRRYLRNWLLPLPASVLGQNSFGGPTATFLKGLLLAFLNPLSLAAAILALGIVSADYSTPDRLAFFGGAFISSFMWFYGFAFGSAKLIRVRPTKRALLTIDLVAALLFFTLAIVAALKTFPAA